MAIIPQFFKDSVVAIGTADKKWFATGFVVARKNADGGYNTFLVTNKHVFENDNGMPLWEKIILRFNLQNKIEAKDYLVTLIDNKGSKQYSVNKNDQTDVASMLINPNVLENDLGGLSAFSLDDGMTLTQNQMLDNDVSEGALVYMLGFPTGIVGFNSKVPLCRLGCISKISDVSDNNSFLVDIQNFPGSSGSPIINRLEMLALEGSKSFNKTSLIGIVSAYVPYEDVLFSRQTGKIMQKVSENSGIAVAFNVDAIKETVEIEFNRVLTKLKAVSPNSVDPNIGKE